MNKNSKRLIAMATALVIPLAFVGFLWLVGGDAQAQDRRNMGTVPIYTETGVLGPIAVTTGTALTSGSTTYLDLGTTSGNYAFEVCVFCISAPGLVECDISASTGDPTVNYPITANQGPRRLLPTSTQRYLRLKSYHGNNLVWVHRVTE